MTSTTPIASRRTDIPGRGSQSSATSAGSAILNKVPEVTLFFWIIKIMCTTVGETCADFLNVDLGFGLNNTSYFMSALLLVALGVQFKAKKYVPGVYWTVVVLISVVGTLITDNLTDSFGVPLISSTIAFAVALAATFGVWFASERTLSIHAITTSRREGFYWTAILWTFALGTAAGDLFAEKLAFGYLPSALMFAGAIAAVAVARMKYGVNAVLAFWLAYILTRPLGASIGDWLSQATRDGGLGLGTTGTSMVFLTAILGLVAYLAKTKRDQTPPDVVVANA